MHLRILETFLPFVGGPNAVTSMIQSITCCNPQSAANTLDSVIDPIRRHPAFQSKARELSIRERIQAARTARQDSAVSVLRKGPEVAGHEEGCVRLIERRESHAVKTSEPAARGKPARVRDRVSLHSIAFRLPLPRGGG